MIHEDEKQRPSKTYRKLKDLGHFKTESTPTPNELLLVHYKAVRQLQEHTERVKYLTVRHLQTKRLPKGPLPGALPGDPAPHTRGPPPARGTGGAGLTFVSLTFWSLRGKETSPSSTSSEEKTEKERQVKAGTDTGIKAQA